MRQFITVRAPELNIARIDCIHVNAQIRQIFLINLVDPVLLKRDLVPFPGCKRTVFVFLRLNPGPAGLMFRYQGLRSRPLNPDTDKFGDEYALIR